VLAMMVRSAGATTTITSVVGSLFLLVRQSEKTAAAAAARIAGAVPLGADLQPGFPYAFTVIDDHLFFSGSPGDAFVASDATDPDASLSRIPELNGLDPIYYYHSDANDDQVAIITTSRDEAVVSYNLTTHETINTGLGFDFPSDPEGYQFFDIQDSNRNYFCFTAFNNIESSGF